VKPKGKVTEMSVNRDLQLADVEKFLNASTGQEPITLDQSEMDTDFDDLGVDSLALMEVVDRVQEACGVLIDNDTVPDLRTPRLLLDHVNSQLVALDS
jgi:minimal PKS acyl carrier protein